jgi:hypothetical protein
VSEALQLSLIDQVLPAVSDYLPADDALEEYLQERGAALTKSVKASLCQHYANRQQRGVCTVFEELSNSTGMKITGFMDLFVLHYYMMDDWKRVAYEVKISRSDFLHELKHPEKRAFALSVSTHFYFATPPNLVRPSEVPAECGLVWVYANGIVRVKRPAPQRKVERPPWDFVAALVRRAANATNYQEARSS